MIEDEIGICPQWSSVTDVMSCITGYCNIDGRLCLRKMANYFRYLKCSSYQKYLKDDYDD